MAYKMRGEDLSYRRKQINPCVIRVLKPEDFEYGNDKAKKDLRSFQNFVSLGSTICNE
ncbi:hypothetical protein GCM10022210_06830 [Mucilaginibacter dorajii]|uniref:Uncharacterized protein n=1 Tax=Mucilaginibacter dorajii TaxID=692994 RepID=A0ABP7P8N4_9SPHI